jgi:lysozyme family protein
VALTQAQQLAIVAGILEREGGLVDHPADTGGITKYGISQQAYPTVDIRALTKADAITIYLRDFVRHYQLHRLQSAVNAEIVCDWLVNSGPLAIKPLQRALRVTVDGRIGPETLTAIDAADARTLLRARLDYYVSIASHPFLKGWVNRLYQLGL